MLLWACLHFVTVRVGNATFPILVMNIIKLIPCENEMVRENFKCNKERDNEFSVQYIRQSRFGFSPMDQTSQTYFSLIHSIYQMDIRVHASSIIMNTARTNANEKLPENITIP